MGRQEPTPKPSSLHRHYQYTGMLIPIQEANVIFREELRLYLSPDRLSRGYEWVSRDLKVNMGVVNN